MRIGLVDVDNHGKQTRFPNLCLMKLSAHHKSIGDTVEWHDPYQYYDTVYMSKVFSFTPDYDEPILTRKIVRGGSGYCIHLDDAKKECFDKTTDILLPEHIEHIMPDYSLYGITDTAYGFMSRGCPRRCGFCHVASKEGRISRKVADLSEFWSGQKNIQLMDPNTLACPDWKDILMQLADSKAYVDFNQGVDVRLITEQKAELLRKIKIRTIHMAYDRYQDKPVMEQKLREFKNVTGWKRSKVMVFVLCNFDTTLEQDLDRVMFLRSLDFMPYIMLYNKASIPRGHILYKLARWCNRAGLFWKYETLEDYLAHEKETH